MTQTALITGASSGIGADFARLFAADGYELVLVARSEGKMQELAKTFGVKSTILPFDLARPGAAKRLFDALVERSINIDVLVNNAGLGTAGKFLEYDVAKDDDMIEVNIFALTELTKLLLPAMVSRKQGKILNVASTAAFQPGPLMAVYYATKAYVLSFSEAIADELRGTGVTVTALCPGPTSTGFGAAAGVNQTRLFTLMKPMTSMEVAKKGYEAMKRGQRVVVTGMMNRLLVQSVRISPRRVVTTIVRKLQESRL
ncbi:MAG TPA: SDR family oxidoreductase [Thermoanaerobaculia bacterium]|nr:SDR family oxidoreductase [Thermoanaerobaculia bacterium]